MESSKQIRSLACCSMMIDSKSHLVAPAVSTEYPVIQEDAHRRLSQEEQQAFDLASEEDQETARTMVSRLHVELGHSNPRGISILCEENTHTDSSLQPRFSCSACEENQRPRLHPVPARVLHEPKHMSSS